MAKITSAASTLASAGTSLLGSLLGNSAVSQPEPYNSAISLNGKELATSNVKNHKITTNYNMPDAEKNLLNYTNENLLSGLKNVNVFSDDVQKNIQSQVNAYRDKGLKTLDETYKPMLESLKADIASRFGNLDNSVFMDNLNSIEKHRAEALSDLTQDILAKQNELYEQELNNRYNYLNTLSNTNQQLYSNILDFLKLANSTASR